MVEPEQVFFEVAGERCAGSWYAARRGPTAGPAVVMAHGLGGTTELGLDAYARHFQAAGLSTLAFDYRHYGRSSGTPRELLSISRQLADFRAAIAYVRARSDVDSLRVAAWGSSFGGGHVIRLAAEDLGLRAAVAQVPFSDGLASTLRIKLTTSLRLVWSGLRDLLGVWLGGPVRYVKLYGAPGETALLTAPDCTSGYLRLIPRDAIAAGRFHNRVSARTALLIPFYFPRMHLKSARVPLFVAVAEEDSVAPPLPTIRSAREAPRVELSRYAGGHFDYYQGAGFEQLIADETGFLLKHLA